MKYITPRTQLSIVEAIKPKVDEISYDFSSFTLLDFLDWVQEQHRKPIRLHSSEIMLPGLMGFWLATPDKELICYYKNLPRLLFIVTILHELGHIYLNHRPTLNISKEMEALISYILSSDENEGEVSFLGSDFFQWDMPQEQEAESWSILVYNKAKTMQRHRIVTDSPGEEWLRNLKVLK